MIEYKTPLSVRGDSLYCPLCFSLDSYWGCVYDCAHCYLRNMNRVWGEDFRATDPVNLRKKMIAGLRNKNPKSSVAQCLARKKTIRWGNKSDPFQDLPGQAHLSKSILKIFEDLEWSFIIQTMNTKLMMDYEDQIVKLGNAGLATVMPVISPGLEKDWETLERKRTNNPMERLEHLRILKKQGVPVGVNGEPFIPGFHTVEDFENALKALSSFGIRRYNTYNFHFTPYVAKQMHLVGVDIEKIHYYNQDEHWKPILKQILEISKKYNIILGCPDWVNTGTEWKERANTCCGVQAPNPSRFNAHEWKRRLQKGEDPMQILEDTYEGIGDFDEGVAVMFGETSKIWTMTDAGFQNKRIKS